MSSTPWLTTHQADDPFGPMFESISELTERIKRSLEADFAEVALHGEVSNVARPRSGHVYFTLKDDSASIRAVMWKNETRRMAFDLTDGLAVRALGRLTVYPPRGEYQIVVREIEPEGIGALELAFRQRYAKLALEGLFDPGRKRPLPRFPRRIVVVTSPTGAAIRDILQVTSRRWRCAQILIAPARVQGVGADREVVAALQLANQIADADVIIVARGGGSLEDLWTFNEESVVRAIVASGLPVVSAVGH
jgi:exodeoxyribonuclease VII large subunit